jgi:psp operon transcriptional activator
VDLEPFLSPYFQPDDSPDPAYPEPLKTKDRTIPPNLPLKTAVRNLEISMLKEALASARHNQKKAAKLLGLTYDQFRGVLRKYKKEI